MAIVYVSDLDGTLLDGEGKLSDFSRDNLNALMEGGMRFTIATARGWTSAGTILEGLRLTLPVILFNGVMLLDPLTGKPLESCALGEEEAEILLEDLLRRGIVPMVHTYVGGVERLTFWRGRVSPGIGRYLRHRQGDPRQWPVEAAQELLMGKPYYMTAIGGRGQMQEAARELERDDRFSVTCYEDVYDPGSFWLEIMPGQADKGRGLDRLRRRVGSSFQYVCFGDNMNDIPLFRRADAALAVSDAPEAVRKLAGGLVAPAREDGVVKYLLSLHAKRCGAVTGG